LVVGRLGGRLLRWIWTWSRRRARKMDEARWCIRGSTVPDPASQWCARQPWRSCNGNCPRPVAVQDPATRHRCFHPSPSRWVASFHYLACMPQKLPHFLSSLICSACWLIKLNFNQIYIITFNSRYDIIDTFLLCSTKYSVVLNNNACARQDVLNIPRWIMVWH
jgi:hypothetical protein